MYCKALCIHVISSYLSILEESPYFQAYFPIWSIKISLYNLYISLFQITDLPISNQLLHSLFNHSPYFEKLISLFGFSDVSHDCMGLCLFKSTFIYVSSSLAVASFFILRFGLVAVAEVD